MGCNKNLEKGLTSHHINTDKEPKLTKSNGKLTTNNKETIQVFGEHFFKVNNPSVIVDHEYIEKMRKKGKNTLQ